MLTVEQIRSKAATMRSMGAATIEAYQLDELADEIERLRANAQNAISAHQEAAPMRTAALHPITPDDLLNEILIAMDRVVDQDVSIQSLAEAVAAHLRPTVEMAMSNKRTLIDELAPELWLNDIEENPAVGWVEESDPRLKIPDEQIREAQAKINERFGIGTGRLKIIAEPKED